MSMKITLDDKEVTCKLEETVLVVALRNGFRIPTLCYDPLYKENRSGGICLDICAYGAMKVE